jgi:hypothetical protein
MAKPPLDQSEVKRYFLTKDSDESVPCLPESGTHPSTDLSIKARNYDNESIEWEERKTCYMSKSKQGGKVWSRLRIGAMNASGISRCLQRMPPSMRIPPEESARIICGLSPLSYDKKQTEDEKRTESMKIGILGEPIVRQWDSKRLGVTIREVGVGVWKENPVFRGSMDGEPESSNEKCNEDDFVEYKIPKNIYWKLIEYIEAIKKGFEPPPGYHRHIFDSQYDQITFCGSIHGKQRCKFTVVSAETSDVYEQWIPTDHDHWNKVLYPQGLQFYNTYVVPLMAKHHILRIDP